MQLYLFSSTETVIGRNKSRDSSGPTIIDIDLFNIPDLIDDIVERNSYIKLPCVAK